MFRVRRKAHKALVPGSIHQERPLVAPLPIVLFGWFPESSWNACWCRLRCRCPPLGRRWKCRQLSGWDGFFVCVLPQWDWQYPVHFLGMPRLVVFHGRRKHRWRTRCDVRRRWVKYTFRFICPTGWRYCYCFWIRARWLSFGQRFSSGRWRQVRYVTSQSCLYFLTSRAVW